MPIDEFLNKVFIRKLKQIGNKIEKYSGDKVVIVHHNDADGICSGAILLKLFEQLGLKVELISIEKVHPIIVDKIHSKYEGELIIYTDLAGLAGKMIDKVNKNRCMTWIIDHHPAKPLKSKAVFIFDPHLFGIPGDTFISASTLSYIISTHIHRKINNYMKKYAYIAVLGAVGDYHDRSGGVLGFDRYVLDEAVDLKQIKIKIEEYRERYFIKFFDEFADIIAKNLTILGSVGYEKKGYKIGMKACLKGFDSKTLREVEKLKRMRTKKFRRAIETLKSGGLKIKKYCQWFHVEDSFSPMGVKVVGSFCNEIKDMIFVKQTKYLLGFQNCPKYIPDIGVINWKVVKLSGRLPTPLESKVLKGEALGYNVLIPRATKVVAGIADATHRHAAATLIDKGKEKQFIRAFEDILRKK